MSEKHDVVFQLEGGRVLTGPMAAGPWDTSLQHGAAPAALIAWVAEEFGCELPMQVARITIDLLRPVPIVPLEIKAELLREGRKTQLIGIQLIAKGVEVVRASVLKVRIAEVALPDIACEEHLDLPLQECGYDPGVPARRHNGFLTRVSMSQVAGEWLQAGPAAVWFRINRPIIYGVPISPLMRAAIVADFCNGASAVVDFERWTYINADTTLSLSRMPVGDWILLDARTSSGSTGVGVASARLADSHGYFGRAAQTILLERRK